MGSHPRSANSGTNAAATTSIRATSPAPTRLAMISARFSSGSTVPDRGEP